MSDRRRRLSADKEVKDLQVGDFVQQIGIGRKGWVESINPAAGTVTVMWDGSVIRDVLTFAMIRKVRAGGHSLDARRPL